MVIWQQQQQQSVPDPPHSPQHCSKSYRTIYLLYSTGYKRIGKGGGGGGGEAGFFNSVVRSKEAEMFRKVTLYSMADIAVAYLSSAASRFGVSVS